MKINPLIKFVGILVIFSIFTYAISPLKREMPYYTIEVYKDSVTYHLKEGRAIKIKDSYAVYSNTYIITIQKLDTGIDEPSYKIFKRFQNEYLSKNDGDYTSMDSRSK